MFENATVYDLQVQFSSRSRCVDDLEKLIKEIISPTHPPKLGLAVRTRLRWWTGGSDLTFLFCYQRQHDMEHGRSHSNS